MSAQKISILTASEMLSLWKLLAGYEPVISGSSASVEASDGLDIDALLMRRIEGWYADQLLTAPTDALPVYDIADDVSSLTPVPSDGSVLVGIPEGTIRICSVMMVGWQRPAPILPDRLSSLAVAQRNPFSRATSAAPVAIRDSVDALSLYPAPPGQPELKSLLAVIQPRDGIFLMTDALIDRIPRLEP